MNRLLSASAFFLFSIFATRCNADLVYNFRFDQATYMAAAGSTIDVGILLRETATDGEELRFFAGTHGLTGFGPVGINYMSQAPATNVLSIAADSAIALNPAFDTEFIAIDNANSVADVGGQSSTGIKVGSNVASYEVQVANITFTVGGAVGEVADLTFTPNSFGNVFFDDSLFPSEPVSFGASTFTVAEAVAVPEPSSFAIFLLGGMGISFLATRRRKSPERLIAVEAVE